MKNINAIAVPHSPLGCDVAAKTDALRTPRSLLGRSLLAKTDPFRALLAFCLLQSAVCLSTRAQGTAFTYQGQLSDGGSPANGFYDLGFELFDTETDGDSAGAITNTATEVVNGLFTVQLDFGYDAFDGNDIWLEIGAVTNGGGALITLSPRQLITSAPYAIRAGMAEEAGFAQEATVSLNVAQDTVQSESVMDGSLAAVDLADGQVVKSINGLRDDVSLAEGENLTLTQIGQTLTLATPTDWHLTGNAATSIGTNFLGTVDNQPLDVRVNNTRALRLEPTTGAPNIIGGAEDNLVNDGATGAAIGGGSHNSVGAVGDTVGGGYWNQAVGGYSVVGGGEGNTASGYHAFTGGGQLNLATNSNATVVGGLQNIAGGEGAFVGGGRENMAIDIYTTVAGGQHNTATNWNATVGGGYVNTANGLMATVAGGSSNGALGDYATVGGGVANDAQKFGCTVSGGNDNDALASCATVGGGQYNVASNYYAAIGGGVDNHADGVAAAIAGGDSNIVRSDYAAIGGGQDNRTLHQYTTVCGGYTNTASGEAAMVGGGMGNTASGDAAFVGGGGKDWKYGSIYPNQASGISSVVGGGVGNHAGGIYSFVGGGGNNSNSVSSIYGVIGGGGGNTVANTAGTIGGGLDNTATGGNSTVAGGSDNLAGIGAGATVGGGSRNAATNWYSTVPGGEYNLAGGKYSFAAGRHAKAIHEGAFVWADARDLDYFSTTTNEFSIRAEGGVRIDSKLGIKLNDIDQPLITRGWFPFTSGAYEGVGRFGLFMEPWTLAAGLPTHAAAKFEVVSYNDDSTINQHLMTVDQTGTVTAMAFNPTSDRNAKEHFTAVAPIEMLEKVVALPISRWNFKQDPNANHIGPMAQDFYAAFGVGADDRHIATVDADGVALAAIQGLNRKLERENAELRQRIERLEKLLEIRLKGDEH